MPYSGSNDAFPGTNRTASSFGRKSRSVTPSDSTDITPYCKIMVTAGGTLQVLPVENADGAWADLGTVVAGFIVPFEIRRVKASSSATTITIEV